MENVVTYEQPPKNLVVINKTTNNKRSALPGFAFQYLCNETLHSRNSRNGRENGKIRRTCWLT